MRIKGRKLRSTGQTANRGSSAKRIVTAPGPVIATPSRLNTSSISVCPPIVDVSSSPSMVVISRVVPLTRISRISPAFAIEISSFMASSLGSSAGGWITMTRMKATNAMTMSRIMLFLDMFNSLPV
ncbi:MAG: hypothetical protein DDT25_00941 [Chloroflexi bacterium]|nr:hypothetical protein [Chloroflexota bacterium]